MGAGSKLKQELDREYEQIKDQVVDKKAWDEYVAQCQHPLLNEDRMQDTSDPNCVVDLLWVQPHFLRRTSHLPPDELLTIVAQRAAAKKALTHRTVLRRKAVGGVMVQNIHLRENSLLSPRKSEVLDLFGRYHSITEVHKIVTMDWGLDCNINILKHFREANIEKIVELQEAYKRDYSDIRLGHKRSRLDELSYLYNDRKQRYTFGGGREDYMLLLRTIEQIRKEVEGDTIRIDGQLNIDIQATLNFHVFQEMLCDLSIIDMIVSKICAKNNYNPQYLMTKLRSSMYAKLTGFQKVEPTDAPQQEFVYPSQLIYDFGRIERMHASANQEAERKKQLFSAIDATYNVPEEDLNKASSVRAKILEQLSRKKQNIAVSSALKDEQYRDKEEEIRVEAQERRKKQRKETMAKIASHKIKTTWKEGEKPPQPLKQPRKNASQKKKK